MSAAMEQLLARAFEIQLMGQVQQWLAYWRYYGV